MNLAEAGADAEGDLAHLDGAQDKPEWVKDSLKNIEAGTKLHELWTLAVQKNEGHGTPRRARQLPSSS